MIDLFLDGMTIMILLYFVALAGWLVKINIEERMSRGATFGQALRGIVKDLFSITRIG
jgi:hypothetical protein